MSEYHLWPEMNVFVGKFGAYYQPKAQEVWQENGLTDMPAPFLVLNAYHTEPEAFDPQEISYRNPYANPQQLEDNLKGLVEGGWLQPTGDGRYTATEKGRALAQETMVGFGLMWQEPTPADASDMQRLAALLYRLVSATAEAQAPATKLAFDSSRRSDRGVGAPASARINRYLGDLNAYRDDVHLSAWRDYDVSGPAWEAFTFVWNGNASSAEELVQQLPFRQYDEAAYARALQELATLEWISANGDGKYGLTDSGRALRDSVEAKTDDLFYACWDCLSADELKELGALLDRVGAAFEQAG